ncbi:MAG: CAP domain-containing protein [Siculibacillus sp.]|nr:CAP domain-containing protein [Siculibacillus sp.]
MSAAPRTFAPASRRAVLAVGLAGLLAACARGPALVEEIDDIAHVPVDPAKAARLINAYRAENGIASLELDRDLIRIAGEYARHLAEAGRMTHALEPFGGLEQRLKAAGYPYATAGENLGQGYRTIEQTVTGWKHSPAHDRGMKDPDMTRMGIASAENPRKRGDVYWCLIVARPRPAGATIPPFEGRHAPGPSLRLWSMPVPSLFR